MHFYSKFCGVLLVSSLLLAGCGGDSPVDRASETGSSGGTDGGGTGGGGSGGASGITYLPLSVFEAETDFSGLSSDNLFQGYGQSPLIPMYLINPIDAATLQSSASATAENYKVTVDGTLIDDIESFPLLQKVVGSTTSLRTALLFDLSNSVSHVDINALIAEAKAYVAASQAHSDPTISSQEFVVWVFGSYVQEMTSGFTSDATDINAALDGVAALFGNSAISSSSNLHQAIVQAIGRFEATENGISYTGNNSFRDTTTAASDNNDLIDFATPDGTLLSQLVIFSSGPDTGLTFSEATMVRAIESQSFLQYDSASSGSDTMRNLNKPVFYYVVGRDSAGVTYAPLSAKAERTRSIRLSSGNYSFASELITNQIAAIDSRIDRDNQYVYRFAFLPRVGDHTVVFSSTSTGRSYSLTSDYTDDDISGVSTVSPVAEITGAGGEYIANSVISIDEMSTFAPATRWDTASYGPADYDWVLAGGTGTENVDGSYTINSISGASATLTLTNNVIGESFQVTVTN